MSSLFGSPIFEVVIGLSFIYLLLSLICSHINEIIVGLFKWRARDLELGIQNLLCDPNTAIHGSCQSIGLPRLQTISIGHLHLSLRTMPNADTAERCICIPQLLDQTKLCSIFY